MAAESSPHKQRVVKWLGRLKNAYYEIEDIFDELEYQHLESEIKAKPICTEDSEKAAITKGASCSCFSNTFANLYNKVNKKLSALSPTQIKLCDKLQGLKKLAEESKDLCNLLQIQPLNYAEQTKASSKGPAPSASLPVNKVIGRDEDCDRIIDLLVNERVGESNPAIAITGIGGAGKTTLAQLIFNDQRVRDHFNVRIWVCLSPKLDVIKHTTEMIQSASMKNPQLDSVDALQRTITDTLLESKNTLIVLDDIWYSGPTEEGEWSQFLAPFTSHDGEHRILFTSRSTNLPTALGPINHNSFKELEADNFKVLFRYFAFGGDNSRQTRELTEIGDKIAEKLCGSPLGAKAVASRLSKKLNDRFWRDTLNNVNLNDISESLLWTYQRLDAELQRCFSYCSLFPKGCAYSEFDLVNMWVCQNFIKCSADTNDVTEKAKDYLNELIACSFLQTAVTIEDITYYKIHDLLHDMAEKLSAQDCFRIEGGTEKEIPSTVRHISISVSDLKGYIPIILKSDHVRTLYFLQPFVNDMDEIFKELISKLKKLRVLVFCFYNNGMLPELVGELKHLRYLEICRSSISELPESFSKLYHLQVLLVDASLEKLPKNFSNLRKMRQLIMFGTDRKPVTTLPPIANIGNLTSLETVRVFDVRSENGFELNQLGNLKRIKGDLRISNLENASKAHAIEAKLWEKKDIERLELVWSYGSRGDLDLEVIEALQPHENLKHLVLYYYSGAAYPSWLLQNSVIHSLTLTSCSHLHFLPSSLSHCKELDLICLHALTDLTHLPENLTSLKIERCAALVFAPKEEPHLSNHNLSLNEPEFLACWLNCEPTGQNDFIREAVRLRLIPMPQNNDYDEYSDTYVRAAQGEQPLDEHAMQAWWYCHQQIMNFVYKESINRSEFILPSSLTTLTLRSCNIVDGVFSDCLSKLTALSELNLESIMTLTTLPSEHTMRQLRNLKTFFISHCWCLRSLGYLQGLVSLEKLAVSFCPCLDIKNTRDTTTFPNSLQSLVLYKCVIPDDIFTCDMPYLFELKVDFCRGSKFISIGALTSLRELRFWGYPDLFKLEVQSLPALTDLVLVDLPNFQAGSLVENPVGSGWDTLTISNLEMLKVLSSNNAFAYLRYLFIKQCEEETFTFEGLSHIPSLVQLAIMNSKIEVLPNSLKVLSGLKYLSFRHCPDIALLPELPESMTEKTIENCPVLKERCRAPDGPDWPRIAHIPTKIFED